MAKVPRLSFLLLRVIWPASKDPVQFRPAKYGLHHEFTEACNTLNSQPHFQNFLGSIQSFEHPDPRDLGVFEIPREDQRNIKSITTGTVHAAQTATTTYYLGTHTGPPSQSTRSRTAATQVTGPSGFDLSFPRSLEDQGPKSLRFNLKPEVQMQESTEITAWTMNDDRVPSANLTGLHLMIAQDKDEIYLAFAIIH
ncbi:hypothetical protein V8E54_009932 [Elaphomyces granulatus]